MGRPTTRTRWSSDSRLVRYCGSGSAPTASITVLKKHLAAAARTIWKISTSARPHPRSSAKSVAVTAGAVPGDLHGEVHDGDVHPVEVGVVMVGGDPDERLGIVESVGRQPAVSERAVGRPELPGAASVAN